MVQEATSEPDATDSPGDFEGLLLAMGRDSLTTTYGEDEPSSIGFEDDEESGRVWVSVATPGSAASPRFKMKQQLEAAVAPNPAAYGYRDLRLEKVIRVEAGGEITFAPPSPQAGNTGWITHSLASLLENLQDAGQGECVVHAVQLLVYIRPAAGETISATNAYIQFRKPGQTDEPVTVKAIVQNFQMWALVEVELDESEQFEWQVVVGGAAPSFVHQAWVRKVHEPL